MESKDKRKLTITIAGPNKSGKTLISNLIEELLQEHGLDFKKEEEFPQSNQIIKNIDGAIASVKNGTCIIIKEKTEQ